MKVFDLYSKYYDMLYYDKDYSKEVDYIVSLIQKNLPGTKTILDLGCGSGKHTILLAKKGYKIHGIDQSDTMLKEAKERLMNTPGMSANVSFSKGDIRTLEFDEEYDVITALFHVISYLNTNNDLKATFKTVHSLLKNDGIFIFDLWYGPCVLTERPKVTTKEAENEEVKIVRVCNPVMHSEKNQVDVNYQISVTCKKTGAKEEFKETHTMRYLFVPEIEQLCQDADLEIISKKEWMTSKKLGFNTFGACFVVRKK